MIKEDIYTVKTPYRDEMHIRGYSFGKGSPAACIVGSERGTEIQQMYICSQLIQELKKLEANGCINTGKKILVIPVANAYGMNVQRRFFGVENSDINRAFPGRENGEVTERMAAGIFKVIRKYSYGIQLTSFYMPGEFVPHVRMMETGFQNTSLANLFGLPYVVVRKPSPLDTKTLNYNWQDETTAAFSLYTNTNRKIDEKSAKQAVAAVLRFLMRMGIIRYDSHSGYISHIIYEKDLSDVSAPSGGIIRSFVSPGEDVRYGNPLAEIIDPYEGYMKDFILAPTDGIVFYAHTDPLVNENDIIFRLIHRLHE